MLREILVGCGLTEERKWRQACFTYQGSNVAIIQEMKSFLALMFFKGALLRDTKGVLKRPGEHSNAARRFEFAEMAEILGSKALLRRYVGEAIANEKAGLRVTKKPAKLVLPAELLAWFERDGSFKAAFEALTPGRQRGYNIYFSAPKGAAARERRIAKYAAKIRAGKGLHDR